MSRRRTGLGAGALPPSLLRWQAQLQIILRHIADGVTVVAASGEMIYANEAAARLTGFPGAPALLQTPPAAVAEAFDLMDEAGGSLTLADLPTRQAFAGQETSRVVRFRVRLTGEERWAVVHAAPLFDEQGAVALVITIFNDITETKRAEQWQRFLADASALLATSLDLDITLGSIAGLAVPALADGCVVYSCGEDGEVLGPIVAHHEAAMEELYRRGTRAFPLDEQPDSPVAQVLLTGQPLLLPEVPATLIDQFAINPEHRAYIEAAAVQSAMVVPMRVRQRTRGAIILVANGNRRYGPRDLQLAQELAGRASLALENALLYRSVVAEITERERAAQALLRSEERFRKSFDASPVAIAMVELRRGQFVDVNPAFLALFEHRREEAMGQSPESLGLMEAAEIRQLGAELLGASSLREQERQLRTRSGALREVQLAAELLEVDGEPCALLLFRDVTRSRRLEEELRQSQKMEALGRLAGGVAHDFNNILTTITGYSELLVERLHGSPLRQAEQIHKVAARGSALTQSLLTFSRKQVLQPAVIDVGQLVGNLERMLCRLITEDIVLTSRVDPTVGRVRFDPGQLEQVLINLVLNARDAMPGGGRLWVQATNEELRRDTLPGGPLPPGAYVVLRVRDSGCGIDRHVQTRLFEPFFTTKDKGKGTGLGLATAYALVKQSDGHIFVESEVGQGSTFSIYLPRQTGPSVQLEMRAAEPAPSASASETILVVEDEDSLRNVVCRALRTQGYQVLSASNGQSALRRLKRHRSPLHLLLTDVIMPKMNGADVARQLRSRLPGLRVLFMSGYPGDELASRGLLRSGERLLQKPFSRATLARVVRETLDATPTV